MEERYSESGPRQPHPLVNAGMDQLVVYNSIALLRHTPKHARVRIEAGIEEQSGGSIVESGDRFLEGFGIDRVSVQQTRSPRAKRMVGVSCQFGDKSGAQERGGGQREEVVGGEVHGIGRGEGQPAETRQCVAVRERGLEGGRNATVWFFHSGGG